MSTLRELILPLAAAAVVCSLAVALTPEGKTKAAVRMAAALVLAVAVLRPLMGLNLQDFKVSLESAQREAQAAAALGQETEKNLRRDIIEQELETYIVEQARALGVSLEAQVALDEENRPCGAELTGKTLTGEARRNLEALLTEELGIPAEGQTFLFGERTEK